jgi:cytochrome c oxidase subunit 2
MTRKALPSSLAALLAAVVAPAARADWGGLNMTPGVTTLSEDVYSLHMTVLLWCCAIACFVFGWMIISMVRFRKSQGAVPDTKMVHDTRTEIIWTVIPVIILVLLAVPAARTVINLEDTSNSEVNIKVTAYQWKWRYDYLDADVGFFSTLARESDAARRLDADIDPNTVQDYLLEVDNRLVVPVGKKIRLLITAQDVIHAWWVPAFAIKKDAIPGFVNEAWFEIKADRPGIYRGQCTELCGRDHAFMPIVVEAVTEPEYEAWLASRRTAAEPANQNASLAPATVPAG